jgi:catechol 2,3-dioxygenase-like lactoylglutathione lyase family enzyme
MISKLTHVCVYVLNQESAYEFYTKKLGFKVMTDAPMGNGSRWLTVCPPDQPEMEVTLFHVTEANMQSKETAQVMIDLVKKGTFGAGVFNCKDLLATYEELKTKGVVFKKPPTKEFYGFEALFVDDSGNFFSLAQLEKK